MSTTPDFVIADHGSIVILVPWTDAAKVWVDEHISSDAMQWAGGIVIEPRYVGDILAGIDGDGLTVA